ncbi:MAG: phosphoribosyltransferase [Acidilobaceae archaeon]|nr:phosphoribosyltransferase [Acidilobaceae archaeon]
MAKVKVKLVSWEEIVDWSRRLSELIRASGWRPDVIVAVARGGYVPARLLCDFLEVTDLLSVQSQHWVEAAKMGEKAILRYPYSVDMSDKRVLLVDDIVDTGESLMLAKEFILREWRPRELRIATLQWISPVARLKPDYYLIEVKDWVWFQYPWTRLEDVSQFISRIFKEGGVKEASEEELKRLFEEWYGIHPHELGAYWELALRRLEERGLLKRTERGYAKA